MPKRGCGSLRRGSRRRDDRRRSSSWLCRAALRCLAVVLVLVLMLLVLLVLLVLLAVLAVLVLMLLLVLLGSALSTVGSNGDRAVCQCAARANGVRSRLAGVGRRLHGLRAACWRGHFVGQARSRRTMRWKAGGITRTSRDQISTLGLTYLNR